MVTMTNLEEIIAEAQAKVDQNEKIHSYLMAAGASQNATAPIQLTSALDLKYLQGLLKAQEIVKASHRFSIQLTEAWKDGYDDGYQAATEDA